MIEIIAEIGTNHNGRFETALELIDMAKLCDVPTVKFQIYDAEDIVSPLVKTSFYGINSKYTYWKDYINNKLITPKEWLKDLVQYCEERKISVIITVHSIKNAEFCIRSGVKRIKIASMDCNYYSYLEELAKLEVTLILSTGMATPYEIIKSVESIKKFNDNLLLFHCVSTYPTNYEEANLEFLKFLQSLTPNVGLSDHSEKNDLAMMAIVYGIKAIEKHITLDKNAEGPDHPFALDENGLKDLVRSIDKACKAIGSYIKKMSKRELENRRKYRRVAIANRDIKKGNFLQDNDIVFARPSEIHDDVLDNESIIFFKGLKLTADLKAGKPIIKSIFQ